MKIAFFSTRSYEKSFMEWANQSAAHDLTYFEERLSMNTVDIVKGNEVVCCFVNDKLSRSVIEHLKEQGVKLIALRCAGFNQVDVSAAKAVNMPIVRVPEYSPYAVAEHALGLILTLNRKFHRAYLRSIEHNFSLDGLMGFDLHGKTVGIIGTGKIGAVFAKIMKGLGCNVIGYDINQNQACLDVGLKYCSKNEVLMNSDIISLHCPLTPDTYHLINDETIPLLKPNVMLVNTSRGGLIDTKAVIQGLKDQKIAALAIDVYEEESGIFFENLSDKIILDDEFTRLLTFPNVIVTGHQAFFTKEAMENIAKITINNISDFEKGKLINCVY